MSGLHNQIDVVLAKIEPVNDFIKRFTFKRKDGKLLPPFSGGAHTVVEMNNGTKSFRNPYSLMSDPADLTQYQISVRREDDGRGGSLYMHNEAKEGMDMLISYPVNLFALDLRAKKHLMIAGGIGITPFLSQIKQLRALGGDFELHYSVRSEDSGAYLSELREHYSEKLHIYRDDQNEAMPLDEVLLGQSPGTHLYCCGPKGMLDWVVSTATKLNWPQDGLHFEEFLAPPTGNAFTVRLAKSEKTIEVGPEQSLLEAIEAAGVDAPYLCRGGACGQCETNVVEIDGTIEHHDHWLTDAQKEEAKLIMPCVSRFEGNTLVIDR